MMSHRRRAPYGFWTAVAIMLALTALMLALSGCRSDDEQDNPTITVVRESGHPCRCGDRNNGNVREPVPSPGPFVGQRKRR